MTAAIFHKPRRKSLEAALSEVAQAPLDSDLARRDLWRHRRPQQRSSAARDEVRGRYRMRGTLDASGVEVGGSFLFDGRVAHWGHPADGCVMLGRAGAGRRLQK